MIKYNIFKIKKCIRHPHHAKLGFFKTKFNTINEAYKYFNDYNIGKPRDCDCTIEVREMEQV